MTSMSSAYAGDGPPGEPGPNGEFPVGCSVNSFTQEFAITQKVTEEGQTIEPVLATITIADNVNNCGAIMDTTDFIFAGGADTANSPACSNVYIGPGDTIDCVAGSYSADFGDLDGILWHNDMNSARVVFMPFSPVDDTETNSANTVFISFDAELAKSVDDDKVRSGDEVTYTYEVENSGTGAMDCILDDDQYGILLDDTLAGGQEVTIEIDKTIVADITNIATLTCLDQLEDEIVRTAEVTVTVFDPSIDVDKTCEPEIQDAPGTITWWIIVTNNGDATLTNVSLVYADLGLDEAIG
jgi:hypothetical protein